MKNKHIFIIGLIISGIIILSPIPDIYEQPDSHDIWVVEYKAAHANNMSWSLCSGFWYEPELSDIESPCIWHPSEDPETIPHGSIIAGTEGNPPITHTVKAIAVVITWLIITSFLLIKEQASCVNSVKEKGGS
jgi:hypothetical protein